MEQTFNRQSQRQPTLPMPPKPIPKPIQKPPQEYKPIKNNSYQAKGLENYEPVKERIPRFLSKYPDGRIVTEMLSKIQDHVIVFFKAYLYKNIEEQKENMPLATGYSFEREGEGFVNKTCHIENCETSAIGRALANIGIHGKERPCLEEMEKQQKHKYLHDLEMQRIVELNAELLKRRENEQLKMAQKNGKQTGDYKPNKDS